MEKNKVLDEGRQLKRLNAEIRRQSHMHKWFAMVAALDCVLVIFYDQDMRNIIFSAGVCIVCTYLWLKGRRQSRKYRREWDEKYGPKP
ncbi:MAG: hypothetical protein LKK36_06935 [Ewingella americana]|jgi:hypothetical protein|uniref:Uncharacterized protein n=2 Tax=Ewingella americana TaxID=41202 RepID=A0A085GAE7_EWIA3|nr:hypothetical protein [Ewingella americana]KAA8730076.1 hypothetical protein F4W05_07745 [Ewingella americana]KFC80692.1 hypothetical protein GEAM_2012 [Ewingella americana ATCC 33852]MCI1679104.1 hypothetical protein [Ewingella americana]MCI1852252.1 hypothetical protein [Ewingella americana]MCI1862654.1 hypothetical protein [Ewingella americana]